MYIYCLLIAISMPDYRGQLLLFAYDLVTCCSCLVSAQLLVRIGWKCCVFGSKGATKT